MVNYASKATHGHMDGMQLADVLADVRADVRGVGATLGALGGLAQDAEVEPEQLGVFADVLEIAADALGDAVASLDALGQIGEEA